MNKDIPLTIFGFGFLGLSSFGLFAVIPSIASFVLAAYYNMRNKDEIIKQNTDII